MSQDNLPEKISPEGVKVANRYLESAMSLQDTASSLNMKKHEVSEILNETHVKKYVDSILTEAGFRQMDKIERVMNDMLDRKLEELDEAEMGSSKDIAELLSLAHKITTDRMKLLEARKEKDTVVNQKNNQFNIYDSNSNYGKLMAAIANGDKL